LLTKPLMLHPRKASAPPSLSNIIEMLRANLPLNATMQVEALPITTDTQANPTLEEVRVNMAELKAEKKPIEFVTSVGSCVAICLHDSAKKCGGLAHIMLPNSAIAAQEPLPAKFANTAVPALIKEVRKLSGKESRFTAKIAGGANMFPNMNALNIGAKNVDAVKAALAQHKIRLIAEDVGGSHGRRVSFDIATGMATVRKFNGEVKKL
jgi:chemotaxis protein CheD